MTPKDIKALVKALRDNGVAQFKTPELELTFAPKEVVGSNQGDCADLLSPNRLVRSQPDQPIVSHETPQGINDTAEASPEIIHKVVEMTSLLKLSDTDLVDRLFPDHTDYGDDEVVA